MEIRQWATRILAADTLEEKLLDPERLTDEDPGPPVRWKEPSRPLGMELRKREKNEKLPAFHEHHEADKRAICLHRFAGHELLAVEVMAYALLAFPEAPRNFRRGLAHTLRDEQGHVRLYTDRMETMGLRFGDLPLYRHFWAQTPHLSSPMAYISTMSLTLEMANLDFAPMYGASFQRQGDPASAELMKRILQDEIGHVRFGLSWLRKMKKNSQSDWEAWRENLSELMTPKRARGFVLHEEPRRAAGIPEDWIQNLKQT